MDPTERARLMDKYDEIDDKAARDFGTPEYRARELIASRIIDGSDNPDDMRIWIRQYCGCWARTPDVMEIKAAIRQQIITGRLGDVYRITLNPPKKRDSRERIYRWDPVSVGYIDAPPSETLRDALAAYDALHGTDLLGLHRDTWRRKICRHGKGGENAQPMTPDQVRRFIEWIKSHKEARP